MMKKTSNDPTTEASLDTICFVIAMSIATLGPDAVKTLIKNLKTVTPSFNDPDLNEVGQANLDRISLYLKLAAEKFEEKEEIHA